MAGRPAEDEKKEPLVVKENPKRLITYVSVGFRIYCEEGETSNKKDENNQYFHGYGEKSDEIVPLYDPSLRILDQHRINKYHPDKP